MTSETRDQLKVLVGRLALVAVCIALWEIATRTVIDPFFVSSPSRIAGSLFGEITDFGFYRDLYVSGIEMLLGFGLGSLAGIITGVLLARWEIIAKIIDLGLTHQSTLIVITLQRCRRQCLDVLRFRRAEKPLCYHMQSDRVCNRPSKIRF